MNNTLLPAASPARTWRAFFRAQLRWRNVVLLLAGLASLWLWRQFTQPSFEETVAEIAKLRGVVDQQEYWPDWFHAIDRDWVPVELSEYIHFEPRTRLVLLDRETENHKRILQLASRFRRLQNLSLQSPVTRDEDLAFLQGMNGLTSFSSDGSPLRGEFLRYLAGHRNLNNLYVSSEHLDDSFTKLLRRLPPTVSTLSLEGKGLTDQTVEQLSHLENIEGLALRKGKLSGSTLGDLRLSQLKSLVLDESALSNEALTRLPNALNIEFLSLNDTHIGDNWIRSRRLLPELQMLELKRTSATGRGFDTAQLPKLVILHLDGSPVDNEGLQAMAPLAGLRVLRLDNTEITDSGLPALARHPILQQLSLAGTQITGSGFSEVQLPRLRELNLSGTKLTDQGLENLKNCPLLHSLELKFTVIIGDGFARLSLPELESLNLSGMGFFDESLAHLTTFPKLQRLVLDDSAVGDKGIQFLSGCQQLQSLWLAGTRITDKAFEHWTFPPQLRRLSLQGTQVTDATLVQLARCTTLEELSLHGTSVEGSGFSGTQWPQLKRLGLSKTRFRDASVPQLMNLAALDWLSLEETPLTDAGLEQLAALSSLKYLAVRRTGVTQAGLSRFRKARPDVQIVNPRE